MPSFDPYASWTIFDTGKDIWARRIVAEQRYVVISPIDVDTYVADCIADERAVSSLIESANALATRTSPPRETGVVLDGMRLGMRTEGQDLWWHSHLVTPYNKLWNDIRLQLDANMPECTIPVVERHQWIEESAE